MKEQFIVVVYDISNNRRRVKLHNLLKDYGTPVQYSVFECFLSDDQVVEMKRRVIKLIKKKVDRVRFYPLCNACIKKIEIPGENDILSKPSEVIVV